MNGIRERRRKTERQRQEVNEKMNYLPKFSKRNQELLRVEHQKGVIKNSVNWYSHLMTNELMKHLDRPGWKHESTEYLLGRLGEELIELAEAIRLNDTKERIEKEAADVGNFAMMLADIYRQKCKPKEGQ